MKREMRWYSSKWKIQFEEGGATPETSNVD